MAKLTLTDVTSGYQTPATINANNALIEAALELTLSRDGTSPNTMTANLDMNTNDIVNVGSGGDTLATETYADTAASDSTAAHVASPGDHDGRYYTESEVDTSLSGKVGTAHLTDALAHTAEFAAKADVSDLTDHEAEANPHSSSAASGANSDITSLTGLTTDLSIAQGGTGQSTGQLAINALTDSASATTDHALVRNSSGEVVWAAQFGASGTGQSNDGTNEGSGKHIYQGKTSSSLNFRSIIGGDGITATQNTDDITLSVDAHSCVSAGLAMTAMASGAINPVPLTDPYPSTHTLGTDLSIDAVTDRIDNDSGKAVLLHVDLTITTFRGTIPTISHHGVNFNIAGGAGIIIDGVPAGQLITCSVFNPTVSSKVIDGTASWSGHVYLPIGGYLYVTKADDEWTSTVNHDCYGGITARVIGYP